MSNIQSPLDQILYDITMEHLAKLGDYLPGPIKKAGGTRNHLLQRYRDDPVYNIFGLDSNEYLGATLAGGTVTSIHRKLGDIFEGCVRAVFMHVFELTADDIVYSATIRSGENDETRSADTYLQFDRLPSRASRRISNYCGRELQRLTSSPQVNLIGLGMEVRHCYQTGDSKRTQADEAMARHLLVSGILPIMPLFCNQSNPGIIQRYRSVWVVKEGMESYEMVREMSGYDFYDFLRRNKEDFRKPIFDLLRSLTA
ncbi:MAG: hypothetical protein KKA28_10010 [Planctomycetes bacterium]|nr:hypothetical protein [Planctomycetota bacterium]MCG2684729.1 hypothetical protein [Planctomycetales bacterium]